MKRIVCLLMGCVLPLVAQAQMDVEKILAGMTLEEKASLVCGIGEANWKVPTMLVPGACRTYDIPRLGLPTAVLSDGPAGVHINVNGYGPDLFYCTAFPVNTAMAASWNEELLENIGGRVADACLGYKIDGILAPSLNTHRNPLCGRNFEYYSEDPLVSGKMAAAYVRGVQDGGVATSVKHFLANNQESNRMKYNAVISQRALREIYLRGFEIAIKEGRPWSIMTSYNRLNGFYTSENPELTRTLLRDEWGYDGMVVSDWGGGADPIAQMRAGNNLLMPWNWQIPVLVDAVKNGLLAESVLDDNVRPILDFVAKTYRGRGLSFPDKPDHKANAAASLEAARESMVLLKNDGVLPLAKKTRKVALLGKSSYELIAGGTGSGAVNAEHVVSLDEALATAGLQVDPDFAGFYAAYKAEADSAWVETEWYKPREFALTYYPEAELPEASLQGAARRNDIAVLTLGRCSGEGWDRAEDDYFRLSATERLLLERTAAAFHSVGKKLVVVLNVAGVIETASWRDLADAILIAWLPGQEGGTAIADILTGGVNPSGKLAMTYPMTYQDVPSAASFPGEPANEPVNSLYEEGIYVGYRYYDTFGVPAAYDFGYGLSFTTFAYDDLSVTARADGSVDISLRVSNTGKRAGKEVVQIYLTAPSLGIDKPRRELKAFAKTGLLAPKESERLSFHLSAKDLASFVPARSAWVAEAGTYRVQAGAALNDIRQEASFVLRHGLVVEKVHDILYPNIRLTDKRP